MTEEKSFSSYEYDTPLATNVPAWSTDRDALKWTVGGYTAATIPSGTYVPVVPWDASPYLQRVQFDGDNLFNLPNDPSSTVLEHIQDFWNKEPQFRELGITYKRGIMLYGPPGSGKTVTIFRLATLLEEHGATMLMAQSSNSAKIGIKLIKALEPERKIVVIFEDIDGIIRREGDESMTHLLDGETDVDNVLFIATTNYPGSIPDRLMKRPSRFDVVIKIGMPSYEARYFYINSVVTNMLLDKEQLAQQTDGMSVAEIKEAIILIQIFGATIEEAIAKLTTNPIT